MEEKYQPVTEDAKVFYAFYTDLFENHRELLGYYLSDNAILHWFGHTIRGISDVTDFAKTALLTCRHDFDVISSQDHADIKELEFKNDAGTQPSTSSILFREMGQGDGVHNNISFGPSVVKRIRIECESGDHSHDTYKGVKIKYLYAQGAVEFQKPSTKKLLHDTKCKRPCKLYIAYISEGPEDYTILYIIYEGNVKCRRNLLSEFSAEEPEY